MAKYEDIRSLGIVTSNGQLIDDNDVLYIDVFYSALENVEHRYIVDETPSANAKNEVIETSYTSRVILRLTNFLEIMQIIPMD